MMGSPPDLSLAAQKIAGFEGFKPRPYLDTGGVPTVGYGTTHYPNGHAVTLSDPEITPTWGLVLLEHDLAVTSVMLWKALTQTPNINQWSAMLSLAYNVGAQAIANSTLVRLFNKADFSDAAEQFLRWDHGMVNGQLVEIPGLKNRRIAERALFLSQQEM